MLKSSLCNYSDAYILLTGSIKVAELAAGGGNNTIKVVFKNCTPFTDCISKISNTQIGNAKNVDLVRPQYSLIEYSNNYSKNMKKFMAIP